MGFTEEQKAFIKEEAMKKMEEVGLEKLGVLYFKKIFERNPSLMDRFPSLTGNRDIAFALEDPNVKKHGVEVFKTIYQSAVNLCDNDRLQLDPSDSKFLGQVHNKNDVRKDDYPHYGEPYSDIVEELFTDDGAQALHEAHCQLMKEMMSAQAHEELIAEMNATIAELEAASP